MVTHTFVCQLCGRQKEHDPVKRHIPFDWYHRQVNGKVYLLCDSCGNPGHFSGGISPTLRDMFKSRLGIDVVD